LTEPLISDSAVPFVENDEADELQKRNELLLEMMQRRRFDKGCAELSFWVSQAVSWLAVVASFGSGIAVVAQKLPPLVTALIAAIPGAGPHRTKF
jgi:hypothetical protein